MNPNPTNPTDALLPCPTPWCDSKGGEPYVFERRYDCLGVYCPSCSVSTGYHRTQAAAIEQWNTRPTITKQPCPDCLGSGYVELGDERGSKLPCPCQHSEQPCASDVERRYGDNEDAKDAVEGEACAAMRSALERLAHNFDLMLAGKPVRDVAETRAEVAAALSSPIVGGWQPIETAPKDGKPILCFSRIHDHNVTRVLYWDDDGGEGWVCPSSGSSYNPTHWRPLPKAPEEL